jgi:DNA primase small subunit
LVSALSSKWESSPGRSSLSKWADIDTVATSGVSSTLDGKALRDAKQDILLEYTYPRLDAEVSKKLNHLLKSPFCVHPKTGRVCVPIDTRRVEDFDPFTVPTVVELLGDLDKWRAEHQQSQDGVDASMNGTMEDGEDSKRKEKLQDWEKTRLKPYIDYFRGFVAGLLKDEERAATKRKNDETADAMEF